MIELGEKLELDEEYQEKLEDIVLLQGEVKPDSSVFYTMSKAEAIIF